MSVTSRASALALVAVVAVIVSGCVDQVPDDRPTSTPSATPVFATEEEALAAVEATYSLYQETSDLITSEQGQNPERIEKYVTSSYRPTEIAGYESFRSSRTSTSGHSTFDSARFQQFHDGIAVGESITVYLCSDVSGIRLLDAGGRTSHLQLAKIACRSRWTS